MGFTGLSHWVNSDGAADFRYILQQQFKRFAKDKKKLKLAIRKVVDKELDDMANEWNTPGMVNLALCMEVEDTDDYKYEDDSGLPVFSKYLTVTQLKRASRLFTTEIPKWDKRHRNRLRKLQKVIDNALEAS
jgi:hypothetical protein